MTRANTPIAIALAAGVALSGCATVENNPRTAGGAAAGAVGGAVLGTLVGGDDRRNALVGAGIGLLAGAAVGQYLDQQQRDLERDLQGTGANVYRVGDELRVALPAGVTFDVDSATIGPGFQRPLSDVAATLRSYPKSYIDIIGHTDSTGSAEYNQGLSERRADAVAEALTRRGVRPVRIAAYGVGETQPVATNETPAGRAANRRVEIRIIPATAAG